MLRLVLRATSLAVAPPPRRSGRSGAARSSWEDGARTHAEIGVPTEIAVPTDRWRADAWWHDATSRLRVEEAGEGGLRHTVPRASAPTAPSASTIAPRGLFARLALLLASILISFIVVDAAAGRLRR